MSDVLTDENVVNHPIKKDLLNRQNFIQQVKTVIELLSTNKTNSCFAVSGSWGIGKSYILEELEQQLLFEQDHTTTLDKYFVFHFNCWEYDYYEEPLIAIVSSMLDEINTKEDLFSPTTREHILSAARLILSKLYKSGSDWLETKIGINPKEITDELSEIHTDAMETVENAHQYDKYLDFKQALTTLRKRLEKVASERTLIFVVDELDRCIPEYQIKVLERLHHIFNELNNMEVILAVDKAQLERTIQKMFGEHVDTKKYLAKFINFEIELDEGTYDNQFEEALGYYFDQFQENDDPNIIEFKENIFNGIEIRERIQIVEKCHLLHTLFNKDKNKIPATYMCIELFLVVVKHIGVSLPDPSYPLQFNNLFGDKTTVGLDFLKQQMSCEINDYLDGRRLVYYHSAHGNNFINPFDLWGTLLGCYAVISNNKISDFSSNRDIMKPIVEYTRQFWNLLQVIK